MDINDPVKSSLSVDYLNELLNEKDKRIEALQNGQKHTDNDLALALKKVERLHKENEELKAQLERLKKFRDPIWDDRNTD